jgi:hypothetical protein
LKRLVFFLTCAAVIAVMWGCQNLLPPEPEAAAPRVSHAGVRSSFYGIKPFPEPAEWEKAIRTMTGWFEGSTPCAIWIVGRLNHPKGCRLEFPGGGESHVEIRFEDVDRHERFLDHFDEAGIQVFLQVEPGHADVKTLIDLVLGRYRHHPCVIGFGVDVEWFKEADQPGWGVPVNDEQARQWEEWVKAHNPSYRLFLKHWDQRWMPPSFRGDIVFVDDSQQIKDLEAMAVEFESWGAKFRPNPVFFQIGYRSDKPWWGRMPRPAKTIGEAIAARIEQDCGIFWVDFTLKDVLPLK